MTIGSISVGDVGTTITLTVYDSDGAVVDLSTSVTKQIYFLAPNQLAGSAVAKTAAYTDGTGVNGQLRYTLIAGDIPTAGLWSVQAAVTFAGGVTFRSTIQSFTAQAVL